MNPRIRTAQPSDARTMAELLANVDDYPKWKEQGVDALEKVVRASLERNHPERLVLVAELDARTVGYTAVYWLNYLFSPPEGYVSELFVRSDASGRGIGTALLQEIEG
ncbi:MAG: GNAT family N-acetyltransferase [Thermaceae bacterium]|nr:GNAT family N-acetyltransferase [Thermaceae bacterium]